MTAVITPPPAVEAEGADLVFSLFDSTNTTAVTLSGVPVTWTGTTRAHVKCVLAEATRGSEASWELPFDDPRWAAIAVAGRVVRAAVRGTVVDAFVPRIVSAAPLPSSGGARTVTFTATGRVDGLDGGLLKLRPGTESFAGPLEKRLVSGWQLPECPTDTWDDSVHGDGAYPVPPLAFFSPFASWITAPDVVAGDTFLAVYDFTLASAKILVPRRTAKGGCRAWLDGVPIGDTPLPPSGNAEQKTYRAPIRCAAGSHRLAFEVTGPPDAIPELLCEMYAVDDVETGRCNVSTFLFQTGDNPVPGSEDSTPAPWKVIRVGSGDRPSTTIGQAMLTHIAEQHPGLAADFTATLDSNGEEWPPAQNIVADVLTPTPDLFAQFAGSECDVWMSAEGTTLHATRWRERGDYHEAPASPLKLQAGRSAGWGVDATRIGNLESLTYEQTITPDAVTIVYRCRDGYGSVGSGPSRGFDFGDIDAAAAATLAAAMSTARTDRAVSFTATVLATNDDDRFPEDAWLGDAVSLPSGPTASWESQRLVSVEWTCDAAGRLNPAVVELSSAQVEVQSSIDRRLARMRAGNQGEGITAPATLGTPIDFGEATEEKMLFNKSGSMSEGAQVSDRYPFPTDRRKLHRFVSEMSEVGTTGLAFDLRQNGSPFQSDTHPSGADAKEGWIGDHVGRYPDFVDVEITTANDAEGWTLALYHTEPL